MKLFCRLFVLAFLLVSIFANCQLLAADTLSYNFRQINDHIYAGGHPLGPYGFNKSDKEVLAFFGTLKSKGVMTIIDLENTKRIQDRYSRLIDEAGLKRVHVPMNSAKVPTLKEWEMMKEVMKEPVYVHCKWGADRTGAVIARYMVDREGLEPVDAWKGVITGGTYAGPRGGMKIGSHYRNLALFICPDAREYNEFSGYFK